MKLQFTNRQLFYICALALSGPTSFYRLKTQIEDKVRADSADETVQDIEASCEELLHVYSRISAEREGIAALPNNELEDALVPQLLTGMGLTPAQMQTFNQTKALPENYSPADADQVEYAEAFAAIVTLKTQNAAQRERLYQNGKALFITPAESEAVPTEKKSK